MKKFSNINKLKEFNESDEIDRMCEIFYNGLDPITIVLPEIYVKVLKELAPAKRFSITNVLMDMIDEKVASMPMRTELKEAE